MAAESLEAVNSIFQQPWWLDAVAPGCWDEVLVKAGGKTVARLPFVNRKIFGISMQAQPPLTQTLGPWVNPGDGSVARRLANEIELIENLIAQLPASDYFGQCLHYSISTALPFHWKGFDLYSRYTHLLTDLAVASDAKSYRSSTRRQINKAKKLLVVRDDLGLERVIEMNRKTFERQGQALPYDPEVLRRLDLACRARGAACALFAVDARDRLHASVYLVWDSRSAYYLIGGGDPDLRSSGAHSFLIWHAIQKMERVTQIFDFEGSMNRQIGRFFRGFGAQIVPFTFVEKIGLRYRPLQFARKLRSIGRQI